MKNLLSIAYEWKSNIKHVQTIINKKKKNYFIVIRQALDKTEYNFLSFYFLSSLWLQSSPVPKCKKIKINWK